MNRIISLFLICLMLTTTEIVIAYQFNGVIYDTDGAPITGVEISIPELKFNVQTNVNGEFEITLPDSIVTTLLINAAGYEEQIIEINPQSWNIPVSIYLNPRIFEFDEVVVSASRGKESSYQQPRSVLIIDNENIEFSSPGTTAEILQNQPAIEIQKTSHSGGSPIIRGLYGKRVLILTDGVRLNNSTYRSGTNPYLNMIPSGGIKRMELIEGPSSVMYGSDALGGIINIITEPPDGSECPMEISSVYSSADNGWRLSYKSITGIGEGILSFNLDKHNIGDLKGGGNVGKQIPSGWKDISGCIFAKFPVNRNVSINAGIQAFNANDIPRYDRYASGKYETYIYDPRERYLGFVKLKDNDPILNLDYISYKVSFQKQNEGRRYRKTNSNKITLQHVGVNTIHFDLVGKKRWALKSLTTFGAEVYHDKISSWRINRYPDSLVSAEPSIPDGASYLSSGIFIQHNWEFHPRWTIRPGLRYSIFHVKSELVPPFSKLDEYYSDISFSIGAVYNLSNTMNLVSNFNRGFRAPNLDDLTKLEISSAGHEVPSPELSAEHSYQLDIGMKWQKRHTHGDFFIWGSILTDFINRREGIYNGLDFWDDNGNGIKDEGEDIILIKSNSDRFYMGGARANIEYTINNEWSLNIGASGVLGENADTGEPMSKIPPIMGRISIIYRNDTIDRAELYTNFAGRQDRLSDLDKLDPRMNPNGTPAWATLNFRTGFKLKDKVKTTLSIENIFDTPYKRHASGVYSAGINFLLGLHISL